MNDRTAGAVLLVIGVVALFAAIVGGGIKIQQIEVGSVQSKWRQWLLGAFGLAVGLLGLIMVLPGVDPTNNADAANAAAADQNAVGTNTADATATDTNADGDGSTNADAADENAAAAPADDTNQVAPVEDNSTTG